MSIGAGSAHTALIKRCETAPCAIAERDRRFVRSQRASYREAASAQGLRQAQARAGIL